MSQKRTQMCENPPYNNAELTPIVLICAIFNRTAQKPIGLLEKDASSHVSKHVGTNVWREQIVTLLALALRETRPLCSASGQHMTFCAFPETLIA